GSICRAASSAPRIDMSSDARHSGRSSRSMSRTSRWVLLAALLVLAGGCQTTHAITTRGGRADLRADHEIIVHAHGDRVWRLANERRETHHVNSVRLDAIDLGAAPAAALDESGAAWPLWRPLPPVAAHDRARRDVLGAIAVADGRRWECAAQDLLPGSGYED